MPNKTKADVVGLKRLDTGALVKDYESPDKELIQPYQLAVKEVTFEDERFVVSSSSVIYILGVKKLISQERAPPPLKEEFPVGERVIFLGNMAYGVAAQVSSTGEKAMDINLAVSLSTTLIVEMILS